MSANFQLSHRQLGPKVEYYAEWCLRTKVLLRSESCIEAILAENVNEKKDCQAVSIIVRHLSSYALQIIGDKSKAYDIWNALKAAYEDKSPANQLHLFDKLIKLKMGETNDVMAHFSAFDQIIAELKLAGVVAANDEQFLCAILLRSMSTKFTPAVIAISMNNVEELKVEKIKNKLRNHSLTLEPDIPSNVMFLHEHVKTDDREEGAKELSKTTKGFNIAILRIIDFKEIEMFPKDGSPPEIQNSALGARKSAMYTPNADF